MSRIYVQALMLIGLAVFSGPVPAAAQTLDPPSPVPGHTSLAQIRSDIAWFGALCVMDAREIEQFGEVMTLASLARETGLALDDITAVAQTRAAEHAIAVEVLRAGGEPLRDPPEPFLSFLRQTQSDCQNVARSRNVLANAIARGTLPEDAPPRAQTPLRADLDPIPFDVGRAMRMEFILTAVDDVRAQGTFEDALLRLAQAVSGRAGLTLEDIAGLTDRRERRWIAAELLLPNPDLVTDLTAAEAAELSTRIAADPEGPLARYYASLIAANLDHLSDDALTDGSNGLVLQWHPATTACHRIADSAALRCAPL